MEKKKSKGLIIILIIVFLLGVVLFLLLGKDKVFKDKDGVTTTTVATPTTTKALPTEKCDEVRGEGECLYYEEDNIKIVKKTQNGKNDEYYINNRLIANYIEYDNIKVLEDNYVLIDFNAEGSSYQLYDKDGGVAVDLGKANSVGYPGEVSYENQVLTIRSAIILDNVEETICTYKPLDFIVEVKQEIKFENGKFGLPTTVSSKTLKQAAKDLYGKDC